MDRVTLKMVAERARVSSPTASFILNPQSNRKGCFTAATCEKVEAAAIALGYRRNGAAHSTATGRFNCVDLLLSRESVRSIVPLGLIEGVEAELAAAGQRLLISRLPDTELTDARKVPRLLQDLSSDGLLINYNSHVPPAMERLIGRFRLPAVWINSLHEADCVRPDDYAAGRDLTRLLLQRGHRRIAFLEYNWGDSDLTPHYSFHHRFAGYRDALGEAGLSTRHIHGGGDVPMDRRVRISSEWLTADDAPDAVVAYGKNDLEPVLVAMDRRADLAAPALATFHDEPYQRFDVTLPTAVLPSRAVGRAAVDMLLRKIDHGQTNEPVVIPFAIHVPCVGQSLLD